MPCGMCITATVMPAITSPSSWSRTRYVGTQRNAGTTLSRHASRLKSRTAAASRERTGVEESDKKLAYG